MRAIKLMADYQCYMERRAVYGQILAKIVGYQRLGMGRPIYEIVLNGQKQRIAVTVGSNGYIVGANPRGRLK